MDFPTSLTAEGPFASDSIIAFWDCLIPAFGLSGTQ
jgi:hypothetical protein